MVPSDAATKTITYTLTNTGKANRVMHDSAHQPVNLAPGASKSGVRLTPEFARVLIDRKDDVQVVEDKPAAKAPAKTETPSPAQRATELLAKVDDLQIEALRSQAQDVLGDKWPGGTPKKAEVVELLKVQAGAV